MQANEPLKMLTWKNGVWAVREAWDKVFSKSDEYRMILRADINEIVTVDSFLKAMQEPTKLGAVPLFRCYLAFRSGRWHSAQGGGTSGVVGSCWYQVWLARAVRRKWAVGV